MQRIRGIYRTSDDKGGDETTVKSPLRAKPLTLPTWEESNMDINLDDIVPELCYDEDDPALRDNIGPA